jgi:hypothetical protein
MFFDRQKYGILYGDYKEKSGMDANENEKRVA